MRRKVPGSPIRPFDSELRAELSGMTKRVSLLTKTLLVLGLFLIIIPTFFYLNEGIQLSFFTPKIPLAIKKTLPSPVKVIIPQVNIDLPVIQTGISGSTWQIADKGISHLAISANPGENGPIILYGHNTNERFGPIRWLSIGAQIVLTTSDGRQHEYTIVKAEDVDPSKTTIFFSQKGETLYLYTCDGFADLQRFVVIAKPS